MTDNTRRERYAAAMYCSENPEEGMWEYAETDVQEGYRLHADAARAVDDAEIRQHRELHQAAEAEVREQDREITRLREELSYASDQAAEVATLRAELEDARRWETVAKENLALLQEMSDTIIALRAELEATRRAKQENDERFQLEAAHWRESAQTAESTISRVRAVVDQYPNAPWYHGPSLRAALDGTNG